MQAQRGGADTCFLVSAVSEAEQVWNVIKVRSCAWGRKSQTSQNDVCATLSTVWTLGLFSSIEIPGKARSRTARYCGGLPENPKSEKCPLNSTWNSMAPTPATRSPSMMRHSSWKWPSLF